MVGVVLLLLVSVPDVFVLEETLIEVEVDVGDVLVVVLKVVSDLVLDVGVLLMERVPEVCVVEMLLVLLSVKVVVVKLSESVLAVVVLRRVKVVSVSVVPVRVSVVVVGLPLLAVVVLCTLRLVRAVVVESVPPSAVKVSDTVVEALPVVLVVAVVASLDQFPASSSPSSPVKLASIVVIVTAGVRVLDVRASPGVGAGVGAGVSQNPQFVPWQLWSTTKHHSPALLSGLQQYSLQAL